ncbi:MAG: hypothetical protein ABI679_10030 [Gemmatimonadota bacterium]
MNHLSMEQLLQLHGTATDVGSADARLHLNTCEACQRELDKLHQRVARLKALPTVHPPRDMWQMVERRVRSERQSRRNKWMGLAGLAIAATVTLAVVITEVSNPSELSASTAAIDTAKARSRELENVLSQYDPESRVIDGRTAKIAGDLEDRIADLDRQLQMTQMEKNVIQEEKVLRMWRERVGLLDALVDVHVTRASNVGL